MRCTTRRPWHTIGVSCLCCAAFFGCHPAPQGIADGSNERDAGVDGGSLDAGADGGVLDAGVDGGSLDAGADGGVLDAGEDGGPLDAGADGGASDACSGNCTPPPQEGAPVVLFTDVVSGPTSGGEDDNGAYLSIFGLNFGSADGLGTTTRVFIGEVEVAAYKWLGPAKAQPMAPAATLEQLTVQVGSLGNAAPGEVLPIRVGVAGIASNSDRTFMVQPGPMIYVSPSGDDQSGDGSFQRPYKSLQINNSGGAYGAIVPGAFIVMRGGTYSTAGLDNGSQCYFFRWYDKTGTAPTGESGQGYVAIVAYPGESVVVDVPEQCHGGIMGTSGSFASNGRYVVVSGLTVEGNTTQSLPVDGQGNRSADGPINGSSNSAYWRIVNNEVTFDCGTEIVRAGGISGQFPYGRILGNHIHNVGGSTLNHGIYFDDAMTDFEVAYNEIHDIRGGNIIQIHNVSGVSNGAIHHNKLYDGSRYGINLGSGAKTVHIYDNLVFDTDFAGIRSDSSLLDGWVVYNTLYNVNRRAGVGPTGRGAIATSSNVSYRLKHNIVVISQASDGPYLNGYAPWGPGFVAERNLWFGKGSGPPSQDSDPVGGGDDQDPSFVSTLPGQYDLRLAPDSPAIDAGTAAIGIPVTTDAWGRPRSGTPDVGAYEW